MSDDDEKDNITKLKLVDPDNKEKVCDAHDVFGNKTKVSLESLKKNFELIAEIRKANYDAHIKQGFTPEQALYLCRN